MTDAVCECGKPVWTNGQINANHCEACLAKIDIEWKNMPTSYSELTEKDIKLHNLLNQMRCLIDEIGYIISDVRIEKE